MAIQPKKVGGDAMIPARKIFATTIEDAPPVRPAELSAKTIAEQAAGKAALSVWRSVPVIEEQKED